MFTDAEIEKKGYTKIAENLYRKDDELFVQQHGELKNTADLDENVLKSVTDFKAYNREKAKLQPTVSKKEEKPVIEKKKADVKPKEPDIKKPAIVEKKPDLLRGTEKDIIRLMDTKLQLDSIIEASENKAKLGEGLLWHELVFGKNITHQRTSVEPSAELVDMIAQDMGGITTEIVEFDTNVLKDPNTNEKYLTYYCVVRAIDTLTKTSGLGAAEQIIDFDDLKNRGRTFARTNAIRKAERNAKERVIPVPRKAMVHLIRKKLDEHYKKMKKDSK